MLTVVAFASAVFGARSSPKPLSTSAQSLLFHQAVKRTLASKSFTVHSQGQLLVYQAPDRTRAVMGPDTTSLDSSMAIVTIGSNAYANFGEIWLNTPKSKGNSLSPFAGGRNVALQYLKPLSTFRTATLNKGVFTVHEIASDLPTALQTLIFTTVQQTSGGSETSFSGEPAGRLSVTGYITVRRGFVVSEVFQADRSSAHAGAASRSLGKGRVTYSGIDSSPPIAAPTQADLHPTTPLCSAGTPLLGACHQTLTVSAPTVDVASSGG